MVRIMSLKEYADYTGRELAEIEAMVREAEEGAITMADMDPSTLQAHNITPETRARMARTLEKAGIDPCAFNLQD